MIKIFQYNNIAGNVELATPEILLISEFSELMKDERNICDEDKTGEKKLRAFREFTYIYLAIDWLSPYVDYLPQEKHQLSLQDAHMTDEEFNDPTFRAACRKYRALQDLTMSIRALDSLRAAINKFIDYFNNVDPEERDPNTGKPVYKVKDIMGEAKEMNNLFGTLKDVETTVKKDIQEQSVLRGGYTDGFLPTY